MDPTEKMKGFIKKNMSCKNVSVVLLSHSAITVTVVLSVNTPKHSIATTSASTLPCF